MIRFVSIALLALVAAPVQAAEISMLTAGAFKQVLLAALPGFEAQSGHKVIVDGDTAGGLARRIEAGAVFDIVVMTPATIEGVIAKGFVAPASKTNLARVGIGVGVKDGAPRPDLSSTESFRQMVLKARAIAYVDPASGGTSGIYLANLFKQWGIAEQLAPKSVLVPGGFSAEKIISGEAEVAIQQISEILPVKGVQFVGPLPAEIQNYTTYTAGLSARAAQPAAAKALLDYLAGPQTARILADKGMQTP